MKYPSIVIPAKAGIQKAMKYWMPIFIGMTVLMMATFAHADAVMDRINKNGKIRCGYVSYAPASVKDMKTGKMVGYNADLIEEAARRMGLTVEWAVETNWPTMAADLQTDKFDMACVTYWANPKTARQMLSTDAVFYQPVFFAVRADDTRFDKDVSKINDEKSTISVLEGDTPEEILNELYTKAKRVTLPQTASFTQNFQEVVSKRADATISSKPDIDEFMAANPGKIKLIMTQPVRLFPLVMQMKTGSDQLKNALDTTILEMQLDGTVEKIMSQYATGADDYYLIDKKYSKLKSIKK